MNVRRKRISGFFILLLVIVLVVVLPKIFGSSDHSEVEEVASLENEVVEVVEAFDASFESREDYINYINQLPPYDPYVKEPAEDIEKLVEIFYNELPESAHIQMNRNPATKEYHIRTLGEDPTERAMAPTTYHALDDPSLIYFSQWDQRWAFKQYNGGNIASTACGPTTLAVLYANMTGDTSITPDKMSDFAEENNFSVPGHGSSWELMSVGAAAFGLQAEVVPLDEGVMKKTLNQGRPMIAILGPGENFTTSGHFILIWAVEDDKFQVIDVFDIHNSNRLWDYDEFAGQVQNLWAYSYTG